MYFVTFKDENGVARVWGTGISELQAEKNAVAELLSWRKANPQYRGELTKELSVKENPE